MDANEHSPADRSRTLGAILAGGRGTRLGGVDKAGGMLAGVPMVIRVADRLTPQVDSLVLVRRMAGYDDHGIASIADGEFAGQGPLAGLLAALRHAAARGLDRVLSVPTDTPFLPPDLHARLVQQAGTHGVAIAASAGRCHPVVGLWPNHAAARIEALLERGERRIGHLAAVMDARVAGWPADGVDPFFNVNTASDLAEAERLLGPVLSD